MNRRAWFKTLTASLATLATGLGLVKKIKNQPWPTPDGEIIGWVTAYSFAYYDGERWHFGDVMDHPMFDAEAFESRDIASLCKAGEETCDWTMIAIYADDGLKAAEKK